MKQNKVTQLYFKKNAIFAKNNKKGGIKMAYVFKQNMLDSSKYSLKSPNAMTAEGICIHNTANDASAANEISFMIRNDSSTSFHVAVDDKEVVQGVPFDRNCWASSDGNNGNGNRKHIHIEICYSKSGGTKFTEAEKNAAEYTAKLLKERGWNVSKVKKHQDFDPKKKYCPHRTLDLGWQRFVNMVQFELDLLNGASAATPNNSIFKVGEYNSQVETTSNLNVRSARNANSSLITTLQKGTQITVGYIMYEDNKTTGTALWGGVVVDKKQGFIHLGYVKPVVAIPTIQYYPKPTITKLLIAALNSIKIDSSYANREKIAKTNGISNYTGTAAQNTKIFDLLKQGKLVK